MKEVNAKLAFLPISCSFLCHFFFIYSIIIHRDVNICYCQQGFMAVASVFFTLVVYNLDNFRVKAYSIDSTTISL